LDTTSINDIPIRFPDERWEHILTEHAELADMREKILEVVSEPEIIYAGSDDELLAVREIATGKWLVVVYREMDDDGFIITAFWTRRKQSLDKRKVVWSP
jgi:hypothetical protein